MSSTNNNNNNQNIKPKSCVYGCGIQIYWNASVNEYWEVLTKKRHICPNIVSNKNKTSITPPSNAPKPYYYNGTKKAYLDCTNKLASSSSNINNIITVEEYAQKIKTTIKEKCGGLLTSIGVAPTKSVAKIASDYQKPDGLTIVPVDELKNFLHPLEVERISGIGIKTQKDSEKRDEN